MITQAYVNIGRWIADCTRNHCSNAELLELGQIGMVCTECGLAQGVEWPPDAMQIDTVLSARPVPGSRNWAPAGHRQSYAVGVPEGQGIRDLIAENIDHGVM